MLQTQLLRYNRMMDGPLGKGCNCKRHGPGGGMNHAFHALIKDLVGLIS